MGPMHVPGLAIDALVPAPSHATGTSCVGAMTHHSPTSPLPATLKGSVPQPTVPPQMAGCSPTWDGSGGTVRPQARGLTSDRPGTVHGTVTTSIIGATLSRVTSQAAPPPSPSPPTPPLSSPTTQTIEGKERERVSLGPGGSVDFEPRSPREHGRVRCPSAAHAPCHGSGGPRIATMER